MKTLQLFLLCGTLLLGACQKTISDFDPSAVPATGTPTTTPSNTSGSFVATVDGQQLSFTVTAASLLHSASTNEKRMDITGTSTDGKQRIIITLGEETSQGNAISVKDYTLNAFPEDNPATPVDESLTTQGFTTYGTSTGNNTWLYGLYDEKGSFTVTSCDATATLVSGTFATTLTDMIETTHVVKITAGKLSNVKYTVLN